MRNCLVVITLLLLADLATSADTASVEGVVAATDSGHHINGAFVLLHDYTSVPSEPEYSSHSMEMRTGPDGHFAFKVEAGCYDLFVSAIWVAPLSERICVREGQTVQLKLRMKADRRSNLAIN